jgi:hypothetical protein
VFNSKSTLQQCRQQILPSHRRDGNHSPRLSSAVLDLLDDLLGLESLTNGEAVLLVRKPPRRDDLHCFYPYLRLSRTPLQALLFDQLRCITNLPTDFFRRRPDMFLKSCQPLQPQADPQGTSNQSSRAGNQSPARANLRRLSRKEDTFPVTHHRADSRRSHATLNGLRIDAMTSAVTPRKNQHHLPLSVVRCWRSERFAIQRAAES